MTSGRASPPFFYMTARPPVYVCVCAVSGSSHLCVRVCISAWVGSGGEEGRDGSACGEEGGSVLLWLACVDLFV